MTFAPRPHPSQIQYKYKKSFRFGKELIRFRFVYILAVQHFVIQQNSKYRRYVHMHHGNLPRFCSFFYSDAVYCIDCHQVQQTCTLLTLIRSF